MVRLVLFPGVVLDGAAGVDVCPSIAILVRDDLDLPCHAHPISA